MARSPARFSRALVAAQLILVACLLSVFPHGHPVTAPDVPATARDDVHSPRPDPCFEPGAPLQGHSHCATCCFQRLLSGGRVADCVCSAPVFSAARVAVLPRVTFGSDPAAFPDPRGPPAV
jgi:hypothetical protein